MAEIECACKNGTLDMNRVIGSLTIQIECMAAHKQKVKRTFFHRILHDGSQLEDFWVCVETTSSCVNRVFFSGKLKNICRNMLIVIHHLTLCSDIRASISDRRNTFIGQPKFDSVWIPTQKIDAPCYELLEYPTIFFIRCV